MHKVGPYVTSFAQKGQGLSLTGRDCRVKASSIWLGSRRTTSCPHVPCWKAWRSKSSLRTRQRSRRRMKEPPLHRLQRSWQRTWRKSWRRSQEIPRSWRLGEFLSKIVFWCFVCKLPSYSMYHTFFAQYITPTKLMTSWLEERSSNQNGTLTVSIQSSVILRDQLWFWILFVTDFWFQWFLLHKLQA